MSRSRRYLIAWLALLLTAVLAVATFNYRVDPYGLFGSEPVPGLSERKPAAALRARNTKMYQVERIKPDVLILGNSRPEMGIDPQHACLQGLGSVYSLTLPGATPYLQIRQAQHAIAFKTPRLVLMGVDLMDFLVPEDRRNDPYQWPPYKEQFESEMYVHPDGSLNTGYRWSKLADFRDGLLSLSALGDSLRTLMAQGDHQSAHLTPLGFNPADDYAPIIRREGQSALFEHKNREVRRKLRSRQWQLFNTGMGTSQQLEGLTRLINLTGSTDTSLVLFINPYHREYLDVIEQEGYGTLLPRWKELLITRATGHAHVSLWDFALDTQYTGEPRPGKEDRHTVLRWFWEPAHYRRELGDLMIAQMLADRCEQSSGDPPPPGRLLVRNGKPADS